MEMKKLYLFGFALLVGCSSIPNRFDINYNKKPAEDFPKLSIIGPRIVSRSALERICQTPAKACVVINFKENTCLIVSETTSEVVLNHERAHCFGYDHYGDNIIQEGWIKWKRKESL